jgi:hypothetical protein
MEDQEIPMSEGHYVLQVVGAGDQPERDAFHSRLSVRRYFLPPIPSCFPSWHQRAWGMTGTGEDQIASHTEITEDCCS